jgi:hypothetical protein
MGILERVRALLGRSSHEEDPGMDVEDIERRTRGEQERAIETVDADLDRDRAGVYERVSDVDGDG